MADIFRLRAAVAKGLSHPLRLRIVDCLGENGEACVGQLVSELQESQSAVSKHLAVLRDVGIVQYRRQGLKVFYFLQVPCIQQFFRCLDSVLEQQVQAAEEFIRGGHQSG